MPTTLLVAEDEAAIRDLLRDFFEGQGYAVVTAADGKEALAAAREHDPDLVLLDVMMPWVDGFEVVRQLRRDGETPVILLTARAAETDKVEGLSLGADDYVAKPFSTRVLTARVKALLRRQAARAGKGKATKPTVVESHGLRLDPERLEVKFHGTEITVTVTEFRMLEAFATRPGIVLSRDRLMELVRGDDSIVADRIIDTYVRRLRRKLEEIEAGFDLIETVIGAGYRWKGG